jgi:hypothetical protein
LTITVDRPTAPVITAEDPPGRGRVGTPYSYVFTVTGSPAPTFTVGSGTLPNGLSLAPSTGIISGTPTVAGVFTFTITATNPEGSDTTEDLTITIR